MPIDVFPKINKPRGIDMEKLSLVSKMGHGVYGEVYKMENVETKEVFAVKLIKTAQTDLGVDPLVIRELSCLSDLHDKNVVNLIDTKHTRSSTILIFEYLDMDLDIFIQKESRLLTKELIKSLMHQLISGITYCHQCGVIHRDLKPANIFIKINSEDNVLLKIGDFGLSKNVTLRRRCHTLPVVTRVFRAPELLLGCEKYDKSVDMWSIGCIFFCLVMKRDIFIGDSDIEMLFEIFSRLGTPSAKYWPEYSTFPYFSIKFPIFERKPWEPEIVEAFGDDGLDLLSRLLEVNPSKRITADEALKHRYFKEYNEKDEKENDESRDSVEFPKSSSNDNNI